MWVFSLIPFYSSICQLGFISWALKSTDCGWIGIQSWQTDAIRKLIHTCWIPSSTLLKAFLLPCPVCARAPSPAVARTAEARSKLPPKCRGAAKENPFFFLLSSNGEVRTPFQTKQRKPWTPWFFMSSFHSRLLNATLTCCTRTCHFEFCLTHSLETSIESPTLGRCIAFPVMEVRHDSLKVPSSARSTRSLVFELAVNDIRHGINQLYKYTMNFYADTMDNKTQLCWGPLHPSSFGIRSPYWHPQTQKLLSSSVAPAQRFWPEHAGQGRKSRTRSWERTGNQEL